MAADFAEKIDRSFAKMSKGQKAIALYIMQHYDKAAFMTAGALGSAAGVSESTVVRFADSLDYRGYPELQKELQEMLRIRLTGTQRMELTGELSSTKLFDKVLKTDAENIRATLHHMDKQAFQSTVDALLHAKRIYIMGIRSAEIIAHTLSYYLDFILDNVRHVTDTSNGMMEQLIHINARDVFVGISFPRYSKRTVDAMTFAKKHGARCIGITDSSFSPLAELADIKMEIRCDTASFADSLVAPLSVTNALIAAISQEKKQELSRNLKEMESIWNQNQFYAAKK
ncbi:MAG: MurR/RpiR family transcriptional regulator [Clostridia bacterium]|nr:MurR/RpiR family transcriptional regulator [Clostridia bacterium]